MEASVARRVASPTNTCPGAAADWIREAVLTRSPATIPSPSAPIVTAASPVRTPARARRSATPSSRPRWATVAVRSRAARTARSGSSSLATGVPHTAMTASPMNFSMVPPYRVITCRHVSKYRERISRTSSASRVSERAVKPTRSANRTETSRRSATGVASDPLAVPGAVVAPSASDVPHSPQNFAPASFDVPQFGQSKASGDPHSRQNFLPASFSVEQLGQITPPPMAWVSQGTHAVPGAARIRLREQGPSLVHRPCPEGFRDGVPPPRHDQQELRRGLVVGRFCDGDLIEPPHGQVVAENLAPQALHPLVDLPDPVRQRVHLGPPLIGPLDERDVDRHSPSSRRNVPRYRTPPGPKKQSERSLSPFQAPPIDGSAR